MPSSGAYDVPNRSSVTDAGELEGAAPEAVAGLLAAVEPPGLDEGVPVPQAATTIVAAARNPASRWRIGTSRCLVPVPDDVRVRTPRQGSVAARPTDADSRARGHRAGRSGRP